MRGIGYLLCFIRAFNSLKAVQNWIDTSDFFTRSTGKAQPCCEYCINLALNNASIPALIIAYS